MNIKIITIHSMHNPGSVLQAYALQKYLELEGNHVEIIDYEPHYFFSEGSKIKLLLKKILFFKDYYLRKKRFKKFIQENLVLTSQKFTTLRDLKTSNMQSDIFIVGSDQLWNNDFSCGKDGAFYLEFVENGKKISYSTSVGKKDISEVEVERLKGKLENFERLSVREQSTAKLLSEGFNREVDFVCDPVFLLSKERYMKFIGEEKIIEGKYVAIYLSPECKFINELIVFYRSLNYKIVLVGGMTKRCDCDIHLKNVGPNEFLNIIYYSDLVVSTSFHATAFCHIFNKNFLALYPDRNSERIISLLGVSGLKNCGFEKDSCFMPFNDEIDWDSVNDKIEGYANCSKKYLLDSIN